MKIHEAYDLIYKACERTWNEKTCRQIREALENERNNTPMVKGNSVSHEVFQQVVRERDIAIEQLKELGYEFGEKIEKISDRESKPQA